MPPVWKVHLSVHPSIRPSVCPSIRPSVCNSVPLTNKVQHLKFGWWYSNQTWTVGSSMGFLTLHWHHMPLEVGQGQNVGLRDFCHILTLLPPGASVFHKHMSSFLCIYRGFLTCVAVWGIMFHKHILLFQIFQEVIERQLYGAINEGFRILEEGICSRPEDIDVCW